MHKIGICTVFVMCTKAWIFETVFYVSFFVLIAWWDEPLEQGQNALR